MSTYRLPTIEKNLIGALSRIGFFLEDEETLPPYALVEAWLRDSHNIHNTKAYCVAKCEYALYVADPDGRSIYPKHKKGDKKYTESAWFKDHDEAQKVAVEESIKWLLIKEDATDDI